MKTWVCGVVGFRLPPLWQCAGAVLIGAVVGIALARYL